MIFKNQSGARTLPRSSATGQSLLLARCFRHQLLLGCQRDSRNREPTGKGVLKDARMTFLKAAKSSLDEKISLNVSALLVNPACRAGVLTSRPNFSAL
jgi:hypothetical protein